MSIFLNNKLRSSLSQPGCNKAAQPIIPKQWTCRSETAQLGSAGFQALSFRFRCDTYGSHTLWTSGHLAILFTWLMPGVSVKPNHTNVLKASACVTFTRFSGPISTRKELCSAYSRSGRGLIFAEQQSKPLQMSCQRALAQIDTELFTVKAVNRQN